MHKAVFTPANAAMLLIDHQIGTMAWTHSHDINLVKQNALKLARIAKAAGLPTVLTASMEDRIQGPLLPELAEILPEEFAARIKRPGIVNAMHHEGFNFLRPVDLTALLNPSWCIALTMPGRLILA